MKLKQIDINDLCVVRGGSWFDLSRYLRASVRLRHFPWDRLGDLGFRVVLP